MYNLTLQNDTNEIQVTDKETLCARVADVRMLHVIGASHLRYFFDYLINK